MSEITPTAARIVKKGLWKDIYRWIDEKISSDQMGFYEPNERKWISRFLSVWKKELGDLYTGAILFKNERYPRKNQIVVFTWRAYTDSKRLGVAPIGSGPRIDDFELPAVVFTEHAIERMAERLATLDRREILQELTAVVIPAGLLVLDTGILSKHGDYFAVKTPHGIGVLAVDENRAPNELVYLVTWISDDQSLAPKFQKIEWIELPPFQVAKGVTTTIDIPAGATLYLPHVLSTASAKDVIEGDALQ